MITKESLIYYYQMLVCFKVCKYGISTFMHVYYFTKRGLLLLICVKMRVNVLLILDKLIVC